MNNLNQEFPIYLVIELIGQGAQETPSTKLDFFTDIEKAHKHFYETTEYTCRLIGLHSLNGFKLSVEKVGGFTIDKSDNWVQLAEL